jgi:hypothetical protein
MSTYTALNGRIRIYDSSDIVRAAAVGHVEVYDATGPSWTDKTAAAQSAASSLTGEFLVDAGDFLYIGNEAAFARIKVDLDTPAVAAGALTVEYWNGSAWVAVQNLVDGTSDGTDTLVQDGVISFKAPSAWALRGDAELEADQYYVRLSCAAAPSTAPNAELIFPCDGQYLDLLFDAMDLSAPEGHARPEETPILHRGRHSTNTHYVLGPDTPVLEPLDLSFSLRLQNVAANHDAIRAALVGGDANVATWSEAGVSTFATTGLLNGAGTEVVTPNMVDPEKKGVSVYVLWERDSVKIGRAYHGVYFSPSDLSIAEAEDSVTLSVTGKVYGAIRSINHLAQQF